MQGKVSKVCRVPDGIDVAGGGIDINGGPPLAAVNMMSMVVM